VPLIRVLPLDIQFTAADGDTIMGAATATGLYWPTTCGGQGICTSCACVIENGLENLEPMARSERRTLAEERGERALATGTLRLACQARIHGDVIVRKQGVRPAQE
jgi:2Fe-2S ferredoxin